MKIIKKAFFVLLAAQIFFLAGCASSPKNEKDAYYEENVKDFSQYELKNGIPVIFKKTNGGQVFVLRTVFEGGTPLVSPKMAGIEGLALELMFHVILGYKTSTVTFTSLLNVWCTGQAFTAER